MAELPLPVWNRREIPMFQVLDRIGSDYQDGLWYRGETAHADEAEAFRDWINGIRVPLQQELRGVGPRAAGRLAAAGVDVDTVREVVADITGMPAYPAHRITLDDEAAQLAEYQAGVDAGLLAPAEVDGEDELGDSQYEPLLGFIRLSPNWLATADAASAVHHVANALGQASLDNEIDAEVDLAGGRQRHWFGAAWRYDGRYYGNLLHMAAATKIAALTRSELGLTAEGEPAEHPLLEPYRKINGYYAPEIMAAGLDLINRAAGYGPDRPGLFTPLWEFAKSGRQPAARGEIAAIIAYATGGSPDLRLEHLEAHTIDPSYSVLDIVSRIEEACQVDASQRITTAVRQRIQ